MPVLSCRSFAVVGVIASLASWGSSLAQPIPPQGQLAKKLEAELNRLTITLRVEVADHGCSMMGNLNLGVTCRVKAFSLNAAVQELKAAGWQPATLPPLGKPEEQATFVKADRYLTVEASPAKGFWALSMRQRNAAQ